MEFLCQLGDYIVTISVYIFFYVYAQFITVFCFRRFNQRQAASSNVNGKVNDWTEISPANGGNFARRERERQTERGESYARQLMIVFNCWKLTLLCRIEKWIRRTRNYEDTITSWTAGRRRVLATRFLVAPGAVSLPLSVSLPPSSPCHSNHLQCGWLPRIASQRGGKYVGNYLSLGYCFCVFLVSRISFSQLSALFAMCCCHVSGHSLFFSLPPSHTHTS